jgi:hypothetical protein
LGEKVVENLDDSLIENVFLERDFKNRTLIKIVTTYSLKSFIKSGKVQVLLDSIWEGLHASDCDGHLDDFSLLTFLAKGTMKHIPGKKPTLKELLTNNFMINIEDIKFWFQYKYRHESVAYTFLKEFV